MSRVFSIYILSLIVLMSTCGVYAETAPPAVVVSDDFEGYASQAALELVWTYSSGLPLILNAEQNHTLGGGQSVKAAHAGGGAAGNQLGVVQFSTDPVECSIEAWFYDTGEADTYGAVMASPTATSDKDGVVEVGLFPWGGGTQYYYSYYDASGDWERKSSGIGWSVGWHKVEIIFAASGGAIYLDDIALVEGSPNLSTAKSVWLGNPWEGANPMYFDDVTVTKTPTYEATQPVPTDEAINVVTNTTLSWTAGATATSHDVYFGTDFDDVNDATQISSEFKGNQPGTTYSPSQALDLDVTYYWRVDEIDATETFKGDTWSFTTRGQLVQGNAFFDNFEGYADQNELDAVWKHEDDTYVPLTLSTGQNHTLGGSQSASAIGDQFGQVYSSPTPITDASIEVWFYDTGETGTGGGVFAASDATNISIGTVEFGIPVWISTTNYVYKDATDGWARVVSGIARTVGWHIVEYKYTATGGSIYFDDELVLNSTAMTSFRTVELGNPWSWAGSQPNPMYFDDVSVKIPMYKAFDPDPGDNAIGVSTTPTLSWLRGLSAVSHDVYFGTDFDDVNDATQVSPEFKGSQSEDTYVPDALTFGNMYYWRIDEVDASNTYKGDVWMFLVSPTCDTFAEGDINRDCMVDFKDFAALAATWLDCNINNGPCP